MIFSDFVVHRIWVKQFAFNYIEHVHQNQKKILIQVAAFAKWKCKQFQKETAKNIETNSKFVAYCASQVDTNEFLPFLIFNKFIAFIGFCSLLIDKFDSARMLKYSLWWIKHWCDLWKM